MLLDQSQVKKRDSKANSKILSQEKKAASKAPTEEVASKELSQKDS